MKCPRCQAEMSSTTSILTTDARRLVTCHVCTGPGCTKRVLTYARNYRYVAPPTRDAERPPRPSDKRARMVRVARALELDAEDARVGVSVAPTPVSPIDEAIARFSTVPPTPMP
jgi:hypothetical protein